MAQIPEQLFQQLLPRAAAWAQHQEGIMEKTEFFSFKARRAPASFATMEGTASSPWPLAKNGNEKADEESKRTTRTMFVRIAPTLLSGMRTNTNCYVSCTGFAKGCCRYVSRASCAARTVARLSTRCTPWFEEPSTRTQSLERGKSQGSQATVKQSLIDIDVVHQELLKGAPKVGQIAP